MRQHYFYIFLLFFVVKIHHCTAQFAEEVVYTAREFLNSLTAGQQDSIRYELGDSRRTQWSNFPLGVVSRPGLPFGRLSEESKRKFHELLLSFLSAQGYLKTTGIMMLDDLLNAASLEALEHKMISQHTFGQLQNLKWDYDNFFIAVWGEPNMINPWGMKFEGHHLSINLTMANTKISLTPLFMGADPAEVTTTKYAGIRVLSKEEDYGIEFINSLDMHQKEIATLSQAVPEDIITNPRDYERIDSFYGIKGDQLTQVQKENLMALIRQYTDNLEREKASEAIERIKASGIDDIYFAWIGSYERKKPHYYLIHTPDYIIEYDNRGFEENGNHIHTIWREKKKDFGEDLLKKHYKNQKH